MNGVITEIQRFSLNDGPGIRTTVFFKGCNLRCEWCHNPETISQAREICYFPENCIQCYKCINVCASMAHKKIGGAHRFFPALCVKCGKCAKVCYAQAMSSYGRSVSVEEVMREIVQDLPYYKDSGGGVTLSGGEVLCQLEFADALTEACHENEIPVAIETNLCFPFGQIESFLRKLDLIMFDLKLFDDEAHRKWTGASNRQILTNAKQLSALGIPLIVRTPLIPGVTDTEENLKAIAEFVNSLDHVQEYELLNFNPLGGAKYQSLNRNNEFAAARPLPQSRLEELHAALSKHSVSVSIS